MPTAIGVKIRPIRTKDNMTEKRKRYIRNVKEARMFAMFLLMERTRHLDDVDKIDKDLDALKTKWGIDAWSLPDTDWIEV